MARPHFSRRTRRCTIPDPRWRASIRAGLEDATIVREAIGRDVAPRAGSLVSAEGALHECFWDGHTAWIQVALQPMHASVWDRRNVEYLDLGGEGYSFRKTTAPGVCDITYVHKSKGGSPYDGEVVR